MVAPPTAQLRALPIPAQHARPEDGLEATPAVYEGPPHPSTRSTTFLSPWLPRMRWSEDSYARPPSARASRWKR
eukprot:11882212-Alexandrium_andersonii.AAC.1